MSGRKSPIAKARESKASTTAPKKESPIAREREGLEKNERRKSDKGKGRVSPIAKARESKVKKESPQIKNLEVVNDDEEEFPPLSVPFGMECYLTRKEVNKALEFVKKNKTQKFQIYTVDFDADDKDETKEYESVLVFGWFRPAAGVNMLDIWQTWQQKEKKWYEYLWAAGLMPEGKILEECRYPEMLDPVEEEEEDN